MSRDHEIDQILEEWRGRETEYDFTVCPTRTDPTGPYYLQDVVMALLVNSMHLFNAARSLGRKRQRLREHVFANEGLLGFYNDYREKELDDAELMVVSSSNTTDARFLLSTRGKDRGYTTRVEQTGLNGKPIEISMVEWVVVDPVKESDG